MTSVARRLTFGRPCWSTQFRCLSRVRQTRPLMTSSTQTTKATTNTNSNTRVLSPYRWINASLSQRFMSGQAGTSVSGVSPAASQSESGSSSHGPRGRGKRRGRRFTRRLLFYGGLFGLWFYFLDADFLTYLNDYYRTQYKKETNTFENQTFWIVGASSGIGEYLVYEVAQNQAKKIIISSRRASELERVKQKCKLVNPKCQVIVEPLDITRFIENPSSFEENDAYTRGMIETNGDIDVLVINSGVKNSSNAIDTKTEVLQKLVNVNILSPCAMATSMIRAWKSTDHINDSLKSMKNKKQHSIAVTSSLAGKMGGPQLGGPQHSAYGMSKFGLNGYFESLRTEHLNDNLNINILCPGPVRLTDNSLRVIGNDTDLSSRRTRPHKNSMETQRCAQLMCSAIATNQFEAWISGNPELFVAYLRQYLYVLAKPITHLLTPFFSEKPQQ